MGKIQIDWDQGRGRVFPDSQIRIRVGDEILNTRPEPGSEPAPLIINIYNALKYEIIRLNFMLVLNWILCFI